MQKGTHSRLKQRAAHAVRRSQPERRRSVIVLLVLLLLWSICLGVGLAQASEPLASKSIAQSIPSPSSVGTPAESETIGTVDVVPDRLLSGQKLYLDNCATCHIGIPPAAMPSQTWRELIQDSEHYGVTIRPLGSPEVQILWQYLREFSRPLSNDEQTPYRLYQSRIFKALHPRVKLAEKVNLSSCVSCHPGAGAYNFRSLTAEWQNAP